MAFLQHHAAAFIYITVCPVVFYSLAHDLPTFFHLIRKGF